MNRFLDEVKVLMLENGYSIEDIKKVVDSFNHFFEYISRNKLENEFMGVIGSFRTNVLRRIGRKPASNIASVAEFNGTSPASTFIKSCIEKKVQDILNGFLRSSEVYYNMACNSEGIDVTRILAQLSLDNLDRDTSVELTAPNTIISFSTELSLKTLYSIKNYDTIVRNIYSEVTRYENGSYPNEELLNNRLGLIEIVSGDWKNIGISNSAQNTMNNVRDSYSTLDRPVNLPEDDRFGNVKVNGHTLYKVFDNLPEEIRNMIKYQIVTAFARGDKKSLDEKVVSAIDYFLMSTEIDTTLGNMDPTKQMVINSNNFDRMRYLIDQLGSEELLFSMSFATSSYIVARSEVDGRSFSTIKDCDYSNKGIQYTEALDKLISSSSDKKYLLDYIVNNRQLLGVVKTLSPKDLYVLIDMFNLDEINWMKDSCNVEDSCSFREMLHYCVFFKRHLNDYEFRYTGDKYKNINKLFYTIKSTNNLAMLGSQISQWFAEINVYTLSQEEFEALRIFDNEFIFNSLSYSDRILYKKCSDIGVPFKIYYTSSVYTTVINKYMNSYDFSPEDFDNQIRYRINRGYNKVILVNDEKLNNLEANTEVYDMLIQEFGGVENIPNFLISLPIGDIRLIIDFCKSNNQSLKEWSTQLMVTPCFFCRSMFIINKIKSSYEKVRVRFAQSTNQSILEMMEEMFAKKRSELSEVDSLFVKSNNGRVVVKDMDSYLRTIYQDASRAFDFEYEKRTDNEIMNLLLDNGFDYLTASYLQKNSSEETIRNLISYVKTNTIPFEILTLLGSNRLTMDELVEKNQFFLSNGCRLEDVPIYYYTSSSIKLDTFEKLFTILRSIYDKTNIPLILLTNEVDKVQLLINKLKAFSVNIYDFISYLDNTSVLVLDNIDRYIYIYQQLKSIPASSKMELKSFDVIVSDYEDMRKVIGDTSDNNLLLKCSLYSSYNDFIFMKSICEFNNKEFFVELLYFDKEYIKNYFELAYTCILSYRMTRREFEVQDAYNFMDSSGWNREHKEELDKKSRKVA